MSKIAEIGPGMFGSEQSSPEMTQITLSYCHQFIREIFLKNSKNWLISPVKKFITKSRGKKSPNLILKQ